MTCKRCEGIGGGVSNLREYFKQEPNLIEYSGHIPGKGQLTDIDGYLERNGYGLMLEWKGSGVPVPFGQEIMFTNASLYGPISGAIIWGDDPSNPEHLQTFHRGRWGPIEPTNFNLVCERIAKWYRTVSNLPKPRRF